MNLLAITRDALDAHGVPFAVIGATALAAHGVTRTTGDLDLLVTDRRCLDVAYWTSVEAAGAMIDIRRADGDDPLAGVIRITCGDEVPVDVIVGRGAGSPPSSPAPPAAPSSTSTSRSCGRQT